MISFITKIRRKYHVSLTLRNFVIGYHIVEYEQNGSDRATYGAKVIDNLAQKLSHMKGMSKSNLKSFRQFYLAYPQISQKLSGEFKLIAQKSQSLTDQSLHVPIDKLLRTCTFTHFIELINIETTYVGMDGIPQMREIYR